MGAARFVGRVGGLAVAFGIGTTVLTGYGVASADSPSTASSSSTSSQDSGSAGADSGGSSDKAPSGTRSNVASADSAGSNDGISDGISDEGDADEGTGPRRNLSSASTDTQFNDDDANADALASAAEDSTAGPGESSDSAIAPDDADALVAAVEDPTQTPAAESAAPAQAVSVVVSDAVGDRLDPPAGSDPVEPADSPLALALLAFTRREAAAANPTAAVTTESVVGNSLITNPSVTWEDGILRGTLDATSTAGLPLTYTLLTDPSLGGKINFLTSTFPNPSGPQASGNFAYLPYMTTLTDPTQNEKFRILVAETTPFDTFMKQIPIIGLFVDPVLRILYQVPILNQLLAPLIGDSQIVEFSENPYSLANGDPVAFTYLMPSFDGTPISVNYFPSVDVATGAATSAPTVFNGPDLAFPGNTNPDSVWEIVSLVPGLAPLRTGASPLPGGYDGGVGYNVITWDPRGEYDSGGFMQLDNPFFEGRDVSSIISWATSTDNPAQNQIETDLTGDPYIGMVGGSYGGGIQPVVAGTPDKRIDAIVPGIAWNTLNESLYPSDTFKTTIGSELLLALMATGARINSQIYGAVLKGALFGRINEAEQAVLSSAGPAMLASNITAPSLFIQGTVDILFELNAASVNAERMTIANPTTPVKMVWYCGGHGVCLDPVNPNQAGLNMDATLRWLDQYVAGTGTPAQDIPNFQWYDQTGQLYASDLRPYEPGFNNPESLSFEDVGGSLLLVPVLGGSGPSQSSGTLFEDAFALASGSKARNALNLDVALPVGTQIAGTPTLSFTYSGLGTSRAVYAQLVDNATGRVVGNVVTPVSVTLDGREHTLDIAMADIAYTAYDPSDSLTLQITSSATAYANLTAWGFINISDIDLDLPTVA